MAQRCLTVRDILQKILLCDIMEFYIGLLSINLGKAKICCCLFFLFLYIYIYRKTEKTLKVEWKVNLTLFLSDTSQVWLTNYKRNVTLTMLLTNSADNILKYFSYFFFHELSSPILEGEIRKIFQNAVCCFFFTACRVLKLLIRLLTYFAFLCYCRKSTRKYFVDNLWFF